MLIFLARIKSQLTFDILFNLSLVLIFIFSKNYLEEDLIIGIFSCMILFFLFFFLKELKARDLQLLRLNIKKAYRIQKKLLLVYYFFYTLILKKIVKYTKKITSKIFLIKLRKISFNINLKIKNFISKLIFIKIYYLNILINFVFTISLKNLNIF